MIQKKDGMPQMGEKELSRLAVTYFENTRSLVCYRPSPELADLTERLLRLVMAICKSSLDGNACWDLLSQTQTMQTVMDARLFQENVATFAPRVRIWMGQKARCILHMDVHTGAFFEESALAEAMRWGTEQGKRQDMRLYACLCWLDGDHQKAMRLWQLLAYAGETFAMDALAYGEKTGQSSPKGLSWEQIRCQYTRLSERMAILPEKSEKAPGNKALADTVQLILATRDLCRQQSEEKLPLHILQYAADAEATIEEKLRNLQASSTEHIAMLRRQTEEGERTYGF